MNGKKESIEINIPSVTKSAKQPETGRKSACQQMRMSFSYFKAWLWKVWEFCREDGSRVKFSLKAGLAVLLVSLLILFQAPYEVFGINIIWSILTVAIMFEHTVGSTFNRGFNRALGSLLAGILAIGVAQLALCSGQVAEPIIIGTSIFFVGTVTSFMKQWPSLVPYEYGFRVILFTYCLIIVSGYRMGNPIRTSMNRLYSIAIGGFVAVFVNVLVFPIWAGEKLHRELVNSFDSVADSLEECVRKFLKDDGSEHPEFSTTVMDEFPDEPAYKKCKATLNCSAKLESLASSAKWEPPHGRFCHFFYPWSEYVKVGAVVRYCAYEVMALHGVLHSEIQEEALWLPCLASEFMLPRNPLVCIFGGQSIYQQAPYNLRVTFQSEIQDATNQAAELVRSLGKDISNMKRTLKTSLLKRVHSSAERLQRAIDMHSYLLTAYSEPPDNSSKPLQKQLSHTISSTPNEIPDQLADLDGDSLVKNLNQESQNIASGTPLPAAAPAESYHEQMRKQSRRLHSWPSREVSAFEEEGPSNMDLLPKMKALETTAALSLATFTSLLIEFVARLDHLVDAVDQLSRLAKFKNAGL